MAKFRNSKGSTLVSILTVALVANHSLQLTEAEAEVVEWVSRRIVGDVYGYINGSHISCQMGNLTFLTGQNQCVREEDLFRGNLFCYVWWTFYHCIHHPVDCNHTILASESNVVALADVNSNPSSVTHLVLYNPSMAERFWFNESNQVLNSSCCSISRLEVFRGWNQTFEISHSGFSLSDNATVQVCVQMHSVQVR